MDFYLYLLIIITLTIFIIFFGGHNQQIKIEYTNDNFKNLNSVIIFEKKLNAINDDNIFNDKNFVNINKYFDTTHIIIPNFVNCFFIKILPNTIFNIFNIVQKDKINNLMMILFNHKKHNNLELLIHTSKQNQNQNEIGYFYDLEKNISITGLYHIYNNSNEIVYLTCFIVKKPFWY